MKNLIDERDLQPIHENCKRIQIENYKKQQQIKKASREAKIIMTSTILFLAVLFFAAGLATRGF